MWISHKNRIYKGHFTVLYEKYFHEFSVLKRETQQKSAEILHTILHSQSRENSSDNTQQTHNSPHTQALNTDAACRCCESYTHTEESEQRNIYRKIHDQRHLFLSSTDQQFLKKDNSTQSDLNTKHNSADGKKESAWWSVFRKDKYVKWIC